MTELTQANRLLAQLYQIEDYESLDVSSELDVHRLLKAKDYFLQNMYFWGERRADYKSSMIRAEAQYQFARADEKVKSMEKGSSGTKAAAEAESSINFIKAKNNYADICGRFEEAKVNYEYCAKRVDAIQQHISVLTKEKSTKQFIEGGN